MTDEELIKQLQEVTGSKLFFTNTPNHLRLTAADRIEQLVRERDATREAALREAAALCDRYPYVEGVRTAIFELIGET